MNKFQKMWIRSSLSLLTLTFSLIANGSSSEFLLGSSPITLNSQNIEDCYLEHIQNPENTSKTVEQILELCEASIDNVKPPEPESLSPLQKRLKTEWEVKDNPQVVTPHERNYLLPVTYANDPNNQAVEGDLQREGLNHMEAKFQVSFKVPLFDSFFDNDDQLFFAFTLQSHWQAYNTEISSPFRETNYKPELFYGDLSDYQLLGWTNRVNIIGIEHQSNGRELPLSRSWNRVYLTSMWEKGNWLAIFKPWYRLPEDEKITPDDADGDDNPDIERFMGHFEFSLAYKDGGHTYSMMLRNNLRSSSNKGAVQLDWVFPMGSKYKGYAQYFRGYGESLVDYDYSIQRLGIGVLFTDLF
jgi:phospholipase A1